MAQAATIHRFRIELSHVDRGVYESLDLRVARHPSEGLAFMLTRVLAHCVLFEEGLDWGRGGVSSTDEPALWLRDPTGRVLLWVEVGVPSAERVHKAQKAADRVAVFAHKDPAPLHRDAKKHPVHRADDVELYPLDVALLASLADHVGRNNEWTVLINDGQLFVSVGDDTVSAELQRVPL